MRQLQQKILMENSAYEIQNAMKCAVEYGWFIQTLTCNSTTNVWIAIMTKEHQ